MSKSSTTNGLEYFEDYSKTLISVATAAMSLLVSKGILTQKEIEEANKNGYDGLFDLIQSKR